MTTAPETRQSLLLRLRDHSDQQAWEEFVEIPSETSTASASPPVPRAVTMPAKLTELSNHSGMRTYSYQVGFRP